MTDELKPALSAQEWKARQVERSTFYAACDPGLTIGDGDIAGEIQGINIETDALPAVIALAYAALPDDSRYKLTRSVVETLGLAIDSLPRADDEDYHAYVAAERFIAALAALLPPETP